jgi:hypothetical protein
MATRIVSAQLWAALCLLSTSAACSDDSGSDSTSGSQSERTDAGKNTDAGAPASQDSGADAGADADIDASVESSEASASTDKDAGSGPSTDTKKEPAQGKSPLYAVMFEVFAADEGSDSYLSVFDSLDIQELDTKKSREFAGGRAFLQAYDNAVFVGEPTAPTILRFVLDDAGELKQAGELSLANYGLNDASIDDWVVNFISPSKAYFFNPESGVTIIWDPAKMEIKGEIAAPEGYLRDGWLTQSSPAVVRGNKLYRPIYWDEEAKRSEDQRLLVYNTDSDELIESFKETRCTPGNRGFAAEDGTIYFSSWIWAVSDTLLHGAAKNCVLRIPADSDSYDPEWSLTYADIADGREGAMFTYVGKGKAIVSIFHDEEVTYDETTDPYELASHPEWEIFNVDLEARTITPLEGIPLNTGAYTPVTLDGRLFLMVPDAGWEGTQLYEIKDGRADPFVKVPGWSYMFEKIR